MLRRLLLLSGLFLINGCSWPVRDVTNQVVQELAAHPFDTAPDGADARATTLIESPPDLIPLDMVPKDANILTTAATTSEAGPIGSSPKAEKLDLNIPSQLPGSEVPRVVLPKNKDAMQREINRLYSGLPPLSQEPQAVAGPNGQALTLADLQRMAAANSPTLRQAVADVEAAKGALIQAKTYPNPTIAYFMQPTADNSSANFQSGYIDQAIITGGKIKLAGAAAQQDLNNAEIALKRARSDLSTAVRKAYFTLLVDKETLVVTRALVQFTDDIYRVHTGLLRGSVAAPYEPASLRAQAFQARLAYKQAIASYLYDWKQLVATIGMDQMPLTQLVGKVDRLIPYYDYDDVLTYALRHHTDMLTTRNDLRKAHYNLKLAQITTLVPDLDILMPFGKDFSFAPPAIAPGTFGTFNFFQFSLMAPVWDQNKGGTIASQAGLIFAGEEAHLTEVTLTSNLSSAYGNYKNNLYAMEYYRRHILPDLVRYYRGIYARRQVDPTPAFNDLVTAQQTLSQNVTEYLHVLDALWSSVVDVADFLQTDDLFQLAKPRVLPELPDLNELPLWGCDHPDLPRPCEACASPAAPAGAASSLLPPVAQASVPPLEAAGQPNGELEHKVVGKAGSQAAK